MARRLLEKRGHTVVVANNGREALAILDEAAFAGFGCVLMDVQMPEMDGFECTAIIREREQMTGCHLPIIAMTAHAMKGDEARCLAAGMDAYLSKPIQPDELFDVIELFFFFVVVLFTVISATAAQDPAAGGRGGQRGGGAPPGGGGPAMTLTSTAFADGGQIPPKYTQAGDQISPALAWANAPANTVSFVLHVHDLEGVRTRTTDDNLHWVVWNIPASATGLPEGVPQAADRPDGSHQISPNGPVYRGPGAPATGPMHHYTFEIFALDAKLDVAATADPYETRTNVLKAMQGHVLGKAVCMGLFHRPQ